MGALCGIGGGLVIIPVLKQFSRLSMHAITGTSLFAVTIASSFGAYGYIRDGVADIKAAALLSTTAIATTGLGAKLNKALPAKTLTRVFGAFLVVCIPFVLRKGESGQIEPGAQAEVLHAIAEHAEKPQQDEQGEQEGVDVDADVGVGALDVVEALQWIGDNWRLAIIGSVGGCLSGLLGIGGGLVTTTYMAAPQI